VLPAISTSRLSHLCRSRPRGSVRSLPTLTRCYPKARSPRRPLRWSLAWPHARASYLAALPSTRAIETRLLPSSLAATHAALHSMCSGQAPPPSHLLISCIISGLWYMLILTVSGSQTQKQNGASAPSWAAFDVTGEAISRKLECSAVARRPRLSALQCSAFRFADRDHLFRVRTCELASAGKTAPPPDLCEILTNPLFSFSHRTLNHAS